VPRNHKFVSNYCLAVAFQSILSGSVPMIVTHSLRGTPEQMGELLGREIMKDGIST
jgi:hypothetical protein